MTSVVGICNLALSHLGVGKEIATLETEKSQEAAACRRFYEQIRDQVLGEVHWPFATKIADLNLIEENPNSEWAFSYRYPSDCLAARKILSGTRNDNRQTRIPYRIAKDDAGTLLFCDKEEAELEYTVKVTDPSFFPSDFVMALSLRLAGYIAPRVTGGDPFKLGDKAFALYRLEIAAAQDSAFNEEQDEELPDSEFISGRT